MKSGIYKITCLPTQKFYIGSAVNIERRFAEHRILLRKNAHFNPKLQNAWNKYGEKAFYFDVLRFASEDELLNMEQDWLDNTNACEKGFNLAQKAGAGGACKQWIVTDPAGKEHFIVNLSKFCRKHGLNHGAMGAVSRGEVCQHKKYTVRPSSMSAKEWLSTLKRSSKFGHGWKGQYVVSTPDGQSLVIDSLNDFCVKNGLSQGNMASICRGERSSHKGFSVKFLT